MTPGLSKDIQCHVWPHFFWNCKSPDQTLGHTWNWVSAWWLRMVSSIFLRGLCGYIWDNILTLSPLRVAILRSLVKLAKIKESTVHVCWHRLSHKVIMCTCVTECVYCHAPWDTYRKCSSSHCHQLLLSCDACCSEGKTACCTLCQENVDSGVTKEQCQCTQRRERVPLETGEWKRVSLKTQMRIWSQCESGK